MFTGVSMAEKERFEFGSKDTFKSNTLKTATFDIENSKYLLVIPLFLYFYNSIVGQIVVKSWSDAYDIISDYTFSTAVQNPFTHFHHKLIQIQN